MTFLWNAVNSLFRDNSTKIAMIIIPSSDFCPRRTVFVGDYEVAVIRSLSLFVCLFKTFSYFWIQTSEFYETLLVLFIGQ